MTTTTVSAAAASLSLLLLITFLHSSAAQAPKAAPKPPSGPPNVTAILEKGGQFSKLIFLLNTSNVINQIENQLNSSTQGMTLFAPTDNAFNNLKPGTLNNLSPNDQVQLIQYHLLPRFYTLDDLLSVSNPVNTQGSGQDGSWGLNFTGQGSQVNVSTGLVETQVGNPLSKDRPFAVYSIDKVLLPNELFGVRPPSAAPKPPTTKSSDGKNTTGTNSTVAAEPTSAPSGAGGRTVAWGMVVGFGLVCMGLLS